MLLSIIVVDAHFPIIDSLFAPIISHEPDAVEVQNGFQVTFESPLNHFSASRPPNHNRILLKAEIAGAARGSIDIDVSIEIGVPAKALFAEKIFARARREEYPGTAQFCSQ